MLPFVRFLTFWGNSDFFSILNFWGISDLFENEDFDSKFCSLLNPTIFKYSDFFLEFRPFRENYDLFGNSNTSGIIIFSVKILLQLDFLYILTFSGNSHLSPLVNSDFSGKSNLFENSDCWNFDFFFFDLQGILTVLKILSLKKNPTFMGILTWEFSLLRKKIRFIGKSDSSRNSDLFGNSEFTQNCDS